MLFFIKPQLLKDQHAVMADVVTRNLEVINLHQIHNRELCLYTYPMAAHLHESAEVFALCHLSSHSHQLVYSESAQTTPYQSNTNNIDLNIEVSYSVLLCLPYGPNICEINELRFAESNC